MNQTENFQRGTVLLIARSLVLSGFCALIAAPLSGQGYSHGTAGAVITSAVEIVAAIDSKEVNRQYLNDGTSVTEDRISCKVRRIGPYYVLFAGIARATDGFDALQVADSIYQDGDSQDDYAARLAEVLPARLTPILDAVRAADQAMFDMSFRNQDVLQMTMLGVDEGQPRAIVLTFRAS